MKRIERKVGDIHPNGIWVWTEYKPGKFDWRSMKITELERNVLTAMVKTGQVENGVQYFFTDETQSYAKANYGMSKNSVDGVMSSLLKKRVINVYEKGEYYFDGEICNLGLIKKVVK